MKSFEICVSAAFTKKKKTKKQNAIVLLLLNLKQNHNDSLLYAW